MEYDGRDWLNRIEEYLVDRLKVGIDHSRKTLVISYEDELRAKREDDKLHDVAQALFDLKEFRRTKHT